MGGNETGWCLGEDEVDETGYESHLWDSFLYPVETRGPVMVPGAVTPGVCIRRPVFRIQSMAVRQFLDFSGRDKVNFAFVVFEG